MKKLKMVLMLTMFIGINLVGFSNFKLKNQFLNQSFDKFLNIQKVSAGGNGKALAEKARKFCCATKPNNNCTQSPDC